MSNPLVNAQNAVDPSEPPDGITGIGIVESWHDVTSLNDESTWLESGLAYGGLAMEAVSVVVDPVGTLLSYGVAWLIEHIQPLQEALDWFAGDPDGVQAYSEQWQQVATSVGAAATQYRDSVRADTAHWTGAAGDAYRRHAAERSTALTGAAELAGTISSVVGTMGMVVSFVRDFVRDLVADCISRLITYALEALAPPVVSLAWVVPQAVAFIARTVTKIADIVGKLIKTIGNVGPKMARMVEVFGDLMTMLGKGAKFSAEKVAAAGKIASKVADKLDVSGKIADKAADKAWSKLDDVFDTDVAGRHHAKFGEPGADSRGGRDADDAATDARGGDSAADGPEVRRASAETAPSSRPDGVDARAGEPVSPGRSSGAGDHAAFRSDGGAEPGSSSRSDANGGSEPGGPSRSGGGAEAGSSSRSDGGGGSEPGVPSRSDAGGGSVGHAPEGGASAAADTRSAPGNGGDAPGSGNSGGGDAPGERAGSAGGGRSGADEPGGGREPSTSDGLSAAGHVTGSSAGGPDSPSRPASTTSAAVDAPVRPNAGAEAPAAAPTPPRQDQPGGSSSGGAPAGGAPAGGAPQAPAPPGARGARSGGGWTGTPGSPGSAHLPTGPRSPRGSDPVAPERAPGAGRDAPRPGNSPQQPGNPRSAGQRGDVPQSPRADAPTPRADTPVPPRSDAPRADAPRSDAPVPPRTGAAPPRADAPVPPRSDAPIPPRGDASVPPRGDAPAAPRADAPAPPRAPQHGDLGPGHTARSGRLDPDASGQVRPDAPGAPRADATGPARPGARTQDPAEASHLGPDRPGAARDHAAAPRAAAPQPRLPDAQPWSRLDGADFAHLPASPAAPWGPGHRHLDAQPQPQRVPERSTAESMAAERPVPRHEQAEHAWHRPGDGPAELDLPDDLRAKLGADVGDIRATDSGLSMVRSGSGVEPPPGAAVDPKRFTVEVHGGPRGVRLGDRDLDAKELAEVIKAAPGYRPGEPVRLLSCRTGADTGDGSPNFAQQLAKELDTEVVAPSTDAWVDNYGNVYASKDRASFEPDASGTPQPRFDEPGQWTAFRPDGTTAVHDSPYPPGHEPEWVRNGRLADDAEQRGLLRKLAEFFGFRPRDPSPPPGHQQMWPDPRTPWQHQGHLLPPEHPQPQFRPQPQGYPQAQQFPQQQPFPQHPDPAQQQAFPQQPHNPQQPGAQQPGPQQPGPQQQGNAHAPGPAQPQRPVQQDSAQQSGNPQQPGNPQKPGNLQQSGNPQQPGFPQQQGNPPAPGPAQGRVQQGPIEQQPGSQARGQQPPPPPARPTPPPHPQGGGAPARSGQPVQGGPPPQGGHPPRQPGADSGVQQPGPAAGQNQGAQRQQSPPEVQGPPQHHGAPVNQRQQVQATPQSQGLQGNPRHQSLQGPGAPRVESPQGASAPPGRAQDPSVRRDLSGQPPQQPSVPNRIHGAQQHGLGHQSGAARSSEAQQPSGPHPTAEHVRARPDDAGAPPPRDAAPDPADEPTAPRLEPVRRPGSIDPDLEQSSTPHGLGQRSPDEPRAQDAPHHDNADASTTRVRDESSGLEELSYEEARRRFLSDEEAAHDPSPDGDRPEHVADEDPQVRPHDEPDGDAVAEADPRLPDTPPVDPKDRPSLDELIPRHQVDFDEAELFDKVKKSIDGTYAGLHVDVHDVSFSEDRICINAKILDSSGAEVGSVTRDVYRMDGAGELQVVHASLQLDARVHGGGFSNSFNAAMEEWYGESGVRSIVLRANIDVGSYAWARQGYSFANHEQALEKIAPRLDREIVRAEAELARLGEYEELPPGPRRREAQREYLAFAGELDHAKQLQARFRSNGARAFPEPREIADLFRPKDIGPEGSKDVWWAGKRIFMEPGKDIHWHGVKNIAG